APGLTALTTQYDGEHYLRIAREGYVRPELWAFFPLFPLTTKLAGGATMIWAGLAGNLLFLWAALGCLHALVIAHTNDRKGARFAVWAAALFPTALFFHCFYSEALFFALATLAFMAFARLHKRGAKAAPIDRTATVAIVASGLAALTRSSGVLLAPAFV